MFISETENKKVKEIVSNLNSIFPEVLRRVASLHGSPIVGINDPADLTWKMLAKEIELHHRVYGPSKVDAKRHWMRRVMGWFSGGDTFYLNTRALGRASEDIAETITHEDTHLVDKRSVYSFGHGGNKYRRWKEETAPHKVGDITKQVYIENFGRTKRRVCTGRLWWKRCKWV